MPRPRLLRLAVLLCLLAVLTGAQARAQSQVTVTLGNSAVELTGPWKFHTGDNLAWANPDFNDAAWSSLDLDPADGSKDPFLGTSGFIPGWTRRGFPGYSGYAWYRLRIRLRGDVPDLALKMPDNFDDAYQVFVNGQLVGQFGRFTEHAVTPYFARPQAFTLPPNMGSGTLTLAVRVWMEPSSALLNPDPGGLHGPPVLGHLPTIQALNRLSWFDVLRSTGGLLLETPILLLAILIAFGLYWLDRSQSAYLWLVLACTASLLYAVLILVCTYSTLFGANFQYVVGDAIIAPVRFGLWILFWACWFRIDHRGRVQAAVWGLVLILALLTAMMRAPFYGRVIPMEAKTYLFPPALLVKLLLGALLLYIASLGIRRNRTEGWLALPAVVFFAVSVYQVDLLIFHVPVFFFPFGVQISIGIISIILSLAIISVLLVRRFLESERQREHLKLEFEQAQQVQQVLIPESLTAIPGYSIQGEYRPAQQVSGDFVQVIRETAADGNSPALLAVVGDVSGKGLRAAMAVSLIVGTLRTLAEYEEDPARLLTGLNRRLLGRLKDGFATCTIVRITADGECTLANAGHPAPYLNDRELPMSGSLPVGMVPAADYEEQTFSLHPGDRLTLYTDGVLEARNRSGELFGFERLGSILASRMSAASIAEAACDFGQEDDITVLTIERRAEHASEPSEALLEARLAER
jgi:serine phosphatase RsbU (regulator of sigma subunit)